jgi:hypothetical protein
MKQKQASQKTTQPVEKGSAELIEKRVSLAV